VTFYDSTCNFIHFLRRLAVNIETRNISRIFQEGCNYKTVSLSLFKANTFFIIHLIPSVYMERTILLDTDLKIILLDHQNNFVGTSKIMSNATKKF